MAGQLTPVSPIPAQLRILVNWLKNKFGLLLADRINFTRGFYVDGVEVTPDVVRKLVALVEEKSKTPSVRRAKNKEPTAPADGDMF